MNGLDAKLMLVRHRLTVTELADACGVSRVAMANVITHGALTDEQVECLMRLVNESRKSAVALKEAVQQ